MSQGSFFQGWKTELTYLQVNLSQEQTSVERIDLTRAKREAYVERYAWIHALRLQGILLNSDQLSKGPGASPMNTWVRSCQASWEPSLGGCSGSKLISSSLRVLTVYVVLLLFIPIWFHSICPAIMSACTWPSPKSAQPYKPLPATMGCLGFLIQILDGKRERGMGGWPVPAYELIPSPAMNRFSFDGETTLDPVIRGQESKITWHFPLSNMNTKVCPFFQSNF